METAVSGSGARFPALHHKNFALLWSGQTLSRLGDSLYRVALAWWVLEKTQSAAAMGTVLMFSFTPMVIFLLVFGASLMARTALQLRANDPLLIAASVVSRMAATSATLQSRTS